MEAAWLTIIPCRFGQIFPWGGHVLAAYSTSRRRALAALPEVTVAQGGSVGNAHAPEVIAIFDVALIDAVATCLEARRPRQLSPEERARRAARLLEVRKSSQARHILLPETTNGRAAEDQVACAAHVPPTHEKRLRLSGDTSTVAGTEQGWAAGDRRFREGFK